MREPKARLKKAVEQKKNQEVEVGSTKRSPSN
jgi:hypothetical protein